jgi:acyl-CoA synthetase (NDP forming)
VALTALWRQVPLVVLKTGTSELGARVNLSHTSSLAGSDVLCDALFRRVGIARVDRIETFLETLKFLHVHGALPAVSIASASCSGGEAAHVADLAQAYGLAVPPFSTTTTGRLRAVLGDRVAVRNPLDYHTYVWGDGTALQECFDAFLGSGADCHLLVLDFPRADRCDVREFETTVDAFLAAHGGTPTRACVVSSLPEGLPEEVGQRLARAGVAPMQGIADCMSAIVAAHKVGTAQMRVADIQPPTPTTYLDGPVAQLDEASAKAQLRAWGVPVPSGLVGTRHTVGQLAEDLGFPVSVKALSSTLTHKSEVGGVRLGLRSRREVELAVADMHGLSDRFLVEAMIDGAVAELLVGIQSDPRFGQAMTIGAGGVLVELLDDIVTLLLPATVEDIRSALGSMRMWPLIAGFRGRSTNVGAVVDAIESLAHYARSNATRLLELEIDPLLVLPDRVVAVDALIRLASPYQLEPSSAQPSPAARQR